MNWSSTGLHPSSFAAASSDMKCDGVAAQAHARLCHASSSYLFLFLTQCIHQADFMLILKRIINLSNLYRI